jgi:excisionase family DNA binding protein
MFHKEESNALVIEEAVGSVERSAATAPQECEWLTADEAAAYLKVRTRSLLRWVRLGHVRAYMLSGSKRHVWRFRKKDLDAALLAKPVVICKSLPVRSAKGAAN